jgi:hypothetical protein
MARRISRAILDKPCRYDFAFAHAPRPCHVHFPPLPLLRPRAHQRVFHQKRYPFRKQPQAHHVIIRDPWPEGLPPSRHGPPGLSVASVSASGTRAVRCRKRGNVPSIDRLDALGPRRRASSSTVAENTRRCAIHASGGTCASACKPLQFGLYPGGA